MYGMEEKIIKTRRRRFLAFLFDVAFIILIAFTVYMLFGLVFKIDSEGYQNFTFYPLLILIIAYLFFGELIFKNTLGKYLAGIEVEDIERHDRPSTVSLVKRGIIKVFFPVEGLVLIFSKNKKRLGDKWSNTIVVNKETNRLKPLMRLLIGITVLIALLFSFRISMDLAVRKADFYNAGISYLMNTGDIKITGMVKVVNQTSNTADFIVPISNANGDKYAIVYLEKNKDDWTISRTAYSKEHILGFSYGFSY
jgi:uncharacterized RDD family membrane protein YckC